MQRSIKAYTQDEEGDWVAKLDCGHTQHIRHNPPWHNRSWVITEAGRQQHVGASLDCKKCDECAPRDWFEED